MGFFKSFIRAAAVGGAVGKVASDLNAKQNRAYELNEKGGELMELYRYDEALTYFLEAEKLAPNEPAIKNNIQLCHEALRMIEKYNENQQELENLPFTEKIGGLDMNVPEDLKISFQKVNSGNKIGALNFNIPRSFKTLVNHGMALNRNGPVFYKGFADTKIGNTILINVLYLNGLSDMGLFLREMGGNLRRINGQNVRTTNSKHGIECIYGLEGNFIILIVGATENQLNEIVSTNHKTIL